MNVRLAKWQHRVKKRYMALVFLALFLLGYVLVSVFSESRTYTVAYPNQETPSRVEFSDESVVKLSERQNRRDVTFQAVKPGEVTARLYYPQGGGETIREYSLKVDQDLHLTAGPGRFPGDRRIILSVLILFVAATSVSIYTSAEAHCNRSFSYTMVAADTLSLLLGAQSLVLVLSALTGSEWSLSGFFASLHALGTHFVTWSAFVMAPLAVWLCVSNLVLLRKEGFTLRNMLGIFLGLLWGSAYVAHSVIGNLEAFDPVFCLILQTVIDYTIVYFECVLFALALSGLRAARHEPPFDRDCIVILGCQIRKDGTPTPLLRGRLDRALDFEKEQMERGGRPVVFIPSGAQGRNEVCSEARTMANYLMSRGVSASRILLEEQACNTLQNMRYAKELIDREMPGAKAAFSTTGYHVFRSMLWASRTDFDCDGMGSHTKWYYYPNAYLREILGLVAARHTVLWGLLVVILVYLLFGLLAQIQ